MLDQQALDAAETLAEAVHKDQKYGEHPYTKHLGDVVAVLIRFKVSSMPLLCAGWLHDSVEDTSVSLIQIEAMLGREVRDLVDRVTNQPGANRKERHAKTYPRIAECDNAITLKLADRIANTEFCILTNADQLGMYTKEYPSFKATLHKPGVHDAMWRHLDFLMGAE